MERTPTRSPSKISAGMADIVRNRCKRSFYYFVKTFIHLVIQEEVQFNWHIKYLCDAIQEEVKLVIARQPKRHDIIINISPGTTKSTIISQLLHPWALCNDPSIRAMNASYSATVSTDHSVKSRDVVTSELYQTLFPEVRIKHDENTKTKWKVTKGGERIATSVTGAATGFHSHLLLVDDPLNPKEASSEADRLTAKNFMDQTLPTRKVDKEVTLTILIMQRLHAQDPTGNWLDKKDKAIKHICLPGEASKDIKPPELASKYVDGLMDPVRLSRKALDDLKKDLGSYGYAGQIMQTPAPAEGAIWKPHYLIPIDDDVLDRKINTFKAQNRGENIPKEHRVNIKGWGFDWDLAYTKDETNSASAYCEAFKMDNQAVINDANYAWHEFPELINWMKSKRGPHYIEAKASGKSAKQTLAKQGIAAVEVKVWGGGDKVARTQMATPFGEAGNVLVRRSILDRLLNDTKQGLLIFPNTGTDVNDAVVQAINRLLGKRDFFVV